MLLGLGVDSHFLAGEDRGQPFGRPAPSGRIVDPRERLEEHRRRSAILEAVPEILPIAAHVDRGGADAAAEVEREHLGVLVAAESPRILAIRTAACSKSVVWSGIVASED